MNCRCPAFWLNTDAFAPRLGGDEQSSQAQGHGTLTAPSRGLVPRPEQAQTKAKKTPGLSQAPSLGLRERPPDPIKQQEPASTQPLPLCLPPEH